MRTLGVACLALLPLALAAANASPSFSYTPQAVPAGSYFVLAGASFGGGATAASVSLSNATGQRIPLGVALLAGGSFQKAFSIPSTTAPGLYMVGVADSNGRGAVNVTGTLTVVAPGSAFFTASPLSAPAGGTFTVSGTGVSDGSSGVAIALATPGGAVTLLGTAGLAGGQFSRSLTIPAGQTAGSYALIVKTSNGTLLNNTAGPFTVGVPAPSATIGNYPVGVAVNPLTNRIYLPNGADNTTTVLDGATSSPVATVPVGLLPCAVGVDSAANRAYIANLNGNSVSVIDGASNSVIATVPVGAAPCAVAVNPGTHRIYVGNYAAGTISVIDGGSNKVSATITMSSPPAAVAVDTATGLIYSANEYTASVSVIDPATNQIAFTFPAGQLPDALAVNPSTGIVYVANFFSRSVTVYNSVARTVLATVLVGAGPSGVAVDAATNRIYVGNYSSNSVSVIEGASNSVIATIPTGAMPDGIALDPYTRRVYSANSASNSVSVIIEP